MKKLTISVISWIIIAGFAVPACASVKGDVKNGNVLYNKGDYNGAVKKYGLALSGKSDKDIASFNLGTALYKEKSYSRGIDSFNNAIAFGGDRFRAGSDYNIGNSHFRIGNSKEEKDYKGARDAYETALKFYKRSIDLNPNDKDAKFNYEMTARRLLALKKTFQMEDKEDKKDQKKDQDKDKEQNKDKNQDQNQNQNKGQNQDQNKGQEQSQGQKQDQNSKDAGGSGSAGEAKENQKAEGQPAPAYTKGGQEKPENKGQEDKGQDNKGNDQKQGSGGSEPSQAGAQSAEGKPESGEQPAQTGAKNAPEKPEEAAGSKSEQGAGGEEQKGKKEEDKNKGLEFYQSPQRDDEREMSEGEAVMLLEGYKGEEATGRNVRMRNKPIRMEEPAKDW